MQAAESAVTCIWELQQDIQLYSLMSSHVKKINLSQLAFIPLSKT